MSSSSPSPPPLFDPLALDEDGLLPLSELEQVSGGLALRVFAQVPDATIDIVGWDRHAARFFDASVRLSRPKRYGLVAPRVDGAHLMVQRRDKPPRLQTVLLRPRTEQDLAAAHAAEGGGGLALLAKRCQMVVLVPLPRNGDEAGPLFLAALLASVLLGPVLSKDGKELFGARTARERLLALAVP